MSRQSGLPHRVLCAWILHAVVLGTSGCGLVLDLAPAVDPMLDMDGGVDAGESQGVDGGAVDATAEGLDSGGARRDASGASTDGGRIDGGRGDAGSRDADVSASDAGEQDSGAGELDSGAGEKDAGAGDAGGGPQDAGPSPDAGGTNFCSPHDCDGDGTLEDLRDDPNHCGSCFTRCGLLQTCCNGMCAEVPTCSAVC